MMPYSSSPRLSTLEPLTTTISSMPSVSSPSASPPAFHSPSSRLIDPLSDILESIPNKDTLTEEQTFLLWNRLLRRLYPQNGEFDHDTRSMEVDGTRILFCIVGQKTRPSPEAESIYTPAFIVLCKGAEEYYRRDTWGRTTHQLGVLKKTPEKPWCAVTFGCRLVWAFRYTNKVEGVEMVRMGNITFDVGIRYGRVMLKRVLDEVRSKKRNSTNTGMGPGVH
ncbi:hypothetical protein AbraIFM66950_008981 [Aspergillus brasiliensis]|nr:hypothetical protein AbraIFM66950_008981 [Aspergillus brasiliensis]